MLCSQPRLEQVSDRSQRPLLATSQLLGLRRQHHPTPFRLRELTAHGHRMLHRITADRVGADANPASQARPALPQCPCSTTCHPDSVAPF